MSKYILVYWLLCSFSLLAQPPNFGKMPTIGGHPTAPQNPLFQMQQAEQQRILQQNAQAMRQMQGIQSQNRAEQSHQQVVNPFYCYS